MLTLLESDVRRTQMEHAECDRTFMSRPGSLQNGTFNAPTFTNPVGQSRQCVYTFVAGPRQRVELVFTAFNLRGMHPE
uniref:(California timema) hypothetical protein n=1 Tax=Timema californicum TaxID=61474 RepID=A0A7R9P4A4_TIMCA|nr:unnamed protein product [Timema californicum]